MPEQSLQVGNRATAPDESEVQAVGAVANVKVNASPSTTMDIG